MNFKKKLLIFFVIFLALFIFAKKNNYKDINRDWSIGVVSDNGVGMVNISMSRSVVNIMQINKNLLIWFPGGDGWIDNGRVKNILDKNSDKDMVKKIFFYNFGFVPDHIEYVSNFDDWKGNEKLFKNMNFFTWLKFNINRDNLIFNEENISKDLMLSGNILSEIMMRDFANTNIINEEDIKISIINSSKEDGFAGFLSSRIEWAGMLVSTIENGNSDFKDNCLMGYGDGSDKTLTYLKLKEIFNCKTEKRDDLLFGDIEINFGDKYTEMLKYSSYVRTF